MIKIVCESSDGSNLKTYKGDQIKSIKIIQQTNPIASSIPSSIADFVIQSEDDNGYIYEKGQVFRIYNNDILISKTFVKKVKKISEKTWEFNTEDYISLLEKYDYIGGIFSGSLTEKMVIDSIFRGTNIPYYLDGDFGEKVWGYIPYTNCREALTQICFSCQAVVDTAKSEVIRIKKTGNNESIINIPQNRISRNLSLNYEYSKNSVTLYYHSYEESESQEEIIIYDTETTRENGQIFVKFEKPMYDLRVSHGGELIDYGSNYAIFHSTGVSKLYGKEYNHVVKSKTFPEVSSYDLSENAVESKKIENATLITYRNVDNVLSLCYNYLKKEERANLEIVEGKEKSKNLYNSFLYGKRKYGYRYIDQVSINVGDKISFSSYLGEKIGVVEKQTFNLYGGMIKKNTDLKII